MKKNILKKISIGLLSAAMMVSMTACNTKIKVNYDYKDFSIYGELMQYLEKEYPIKVDVGLKYKF